MSLIAICSYIAFLAVNLIDGNVNTRTKNTRTRRRNLIRAWTRMATASSTSFKIKASIVRVATIGKHGIKTLKTTRGTMETPMMTIKTPH
jgi:hypothetical protein